MTLQLSYQGTTVPSHLGSLGLSFWICKNGIRIILSLLSLLQKVLNRDLKIIFRELFGDWGCSKVNQLLPFLLRNLGLKIPNLFPLNAWGKAYKQERHSGREPQLDF